MEICYIVMDIKQKFREEKDMDVYAKDVTDGSFSNIYVKWLEQQLLLHNVSQQSELLLQCYKEGFQTAVDSLVSANEAVKNKTL